MRGLEWQALSPKLLESETCCFCQQVSARGLLPQTLAWRVATCAYIQRHQKMHQPYVKQTKLHVLSFEAFFLLVSLHCCVPLRAQSPLSIWKPSMENYMHAELLLM